MNVTLKRRLRRWLPLTVALALVAGLVSHARPARADVIDFDPASDAVPTLVSPADMTAIEAIWGAHVKYLQAPLSPKGTWAFGLVGPDTFGFINLKTGKFNALTDDPGYSVGDAWWQDDATLGQIIADNTFDADDNPDGWQFTRVTMNATTGSVEFEQLGQAPLTVTPVSASPDLMWLLTLEVPTGTAKAKVVTRRPDYGKPSRLPAGAPGALGGLVPDTITLQQAPMKIVLRSLDSDDRKVLGDLPKDSGILGSNWSPDGKRVNVASSTMPGWDGDRQRDNEPPGAGLPNLGNINVQEALGLVKPLDNPMVTGTRMQVFDAAQGTLVKVWENKDFLEGTLQNLLYAPDSQHALLVIATKSELEGRPNPTYAYPGGIALYLLDADLANPKPITGPDLDSRGAGAGWLDNDTAVFALPHELDTRIATYDVGSAALKTVWSKPGSMWQVMGGGGRVVFQHSTVNEPMELFVADSSDVEGSAKAVTHDNADLAPYSKIKTADVTWTASTGQTLHGMVVYPANTSWPPAKPGPLVVWQQGGPGGQVTNDWGSSVEAPYTMLPNMGIPVFMANAAGRSVQNAQFYSDMAEGTNFGQLDIQQIKEGVDTFVRQKAVDPRRVGITGCSYGGYFTLQSIRTYPGYYAAANTQCSLMDLFEEFTFGYTPFISYLMGSSPTADALEFMKDSPLYGAKDVTTPTLLFHGTDDFLPAALPLAYHDQLDADGVPVTFLRVAGEQHGFLDPGSQLYAAQKQLLWFRKYLLTDLPPLANPAVYLPIAYNGLP